MRVKPCPPSPGERRVRVRPGTWRPEPVRRRRIRRHVLFARPNRAPLARSWRLRPPPLSRRFCGPAMCGANLNPTPCRNSSPHNSLSPCWTTPLVPKTCDMPVLLLESHITRHDSTPNLFGLHALFLSLVSPHPNTTYGQRRNNTTIFSIFRVTKRALPELTLQKPRFQPHRGGTTSAGCHQWLNQPGHEIAAAADNVGRLGQELIRLPPATGCETQATILRTELAETVAGLLKPDGTQ